jgi:hypothetical protein
MRLSKCFEQLRICSLRDRVQDGTQNKPEERHCKRNLGEEFADAHLNIPQSSEKPTSDSRSRSACAPVGLPERRSGGGQSNDKLGAFSRAVAESLDLAAVQDDEASCDAESETDSRPL